MDVNERIKQQLDENAVLLYMKGTPDFPQCGFSGQTVAALKAIGRCEVFVRATSLGGVESLIEHRYSIEGDRSPIPKDLVRLSVGIEAVVDEVKEEIFIRKRAERERVVLDSLREHFAPEIQTENIAAA